MQTTLIGNHRDDQKCNLNQSILQGNGNANFDNLPHYRTFEFKVCLTNRDTNFLLSNHQQSHKHTDCLGKGGAECCTNWPHMQCPHQQVIQTDIDYAGNGNKIHGSLGIPQPTENGTDDVIRCNEWNPKKANGKIGNGSCHSIFRRRHQSNNGLDAYQ